MARDFQRIARQIRGHDLRSRQFSGERQGKNAAAGSDVSNPWDGDVLHERNRFFDDEFRFGPRNEDRGRDEKVASPELARAKDVGGRLAALAARDPFREARLESVGRRFAKPGHQRGLVPVQNRADVYVHVNRGVLGLDGGRLEPRSCVRHLFEQGNGV